MTVPNELTMYDELDKTAKRLGYLLWRDLSEVDEFALYSQGWERVAGGSLYDLRKYMRQELKRLMEEVPNWRT